jgi:SulP family sulfate permease
MAEMAALLKAVVKPSELLVPKTFSVIREGYGPAFLKADAVAGLTVAIVALPLSMAIAIASHAPPQTGLYTAIIGGFLISLLGGSRHQIGGPAGAFIVLVASIIDRHGMEGLLFATLMAGVLMLAMGFLRLGTFIKYVPHPVTVGFTAGIAVIIFASQLRELFGLSLPAPEPAALVPKFQALWAAAADVNIQTVTLAIASVALIVAIRVWQPRLPGFLIAVVLAALAAYVLELDVATIGTRFGGVPAGLPVPMFPALSLAKVGELLPDAFALALLGSIESLLSAVVADSMTGRRHRSNMELIAQGAANIGAALFGGLTATGTIARTATNIRAGAKSPFAGMMHAAFLLAFMGVFAPLMSYIPLASLAAILVVVAWNMAERHAFAALIRSSWGDAAVLLATFGLTVFRDLTEGIVIGVMLGCLLFMHRVAGSMSVESGHDDDPEREIETKSGIMIHRINGFFFFGSANIVAETLEHVGTSARGHVLDVAQVPFIDSSGAHALLGFVTKARQQGVAVAIAGASNHLKDEMARYKITGKEVLFASSVEKAVASLNGGPKSAKLAG